MSLEGSVSIAHYSLSPKARQVSRSIIPVSQINLCIALLLNTLTQQWGSEYR